MDVPTGRGSSADVLLQNYRLGKTLGHGSFAKVKVAEHILTGYKVAIKILNRRKMKSPDMEERVRREIKISRLFVSRLFVHPHIVRQYEVIETTTDIYVVMEYVKCGELYDYIVQKSRLLEDEARKLFQQIISGVEYCHRNMVVHRDLKPDNLLLDSRGNVKLVDFGFSNVMQDGHFLKTSCGSLNYAAPEVVSGKLYAGPEVDVWSCGVILYALLSGTLPFDDGNIPNLCKKIKSGIYTLPSHLSPGARDLILRMLVVDPMKRITIPEIRQHYWFKAHLPRYLAVPPPDARQHLKRIDEDVVNEVLRMGFDRNQLLESLQNSQQNDATVAYYLLFDNRSSVSSGYLGPEFHESMDGGSVGMYPDGDVAVGYNFPQDTGSRTCVPSERKWIAGLQSPAHPHEVMKQVLEALQGLNVRWKKNGPYSMKCLWLHSIEGEGYVHHNNHIGSESTIIVDNIRPQTQSIMKFEMQLYKTREEKYMLDLQRISGGQLLFLNFCSVFIMQLVS